MSPACKKLVAIQAKAYDNALAIIQELDEVNEGEMKDEAAVKAWDLMGETYMDVHSICGGKNPLFE